MHCIVPGGGVSLNNKWKQVKNNGKFLFPVKAMSKVFRGKYMAELKKFFDKQGMELTQELISSLYDKHWVVYANTPFGNFSSVIKYLARYTHKIAITNHRIIAYDDHSVTFRYTDYRHAHQRKSMTLSLWEFVRRFTLHLLPKRFTRIRHFGLLSSKSKSKLIEIPTDSRKLSWKNI